ncbi:MAG: HAD family hydrolase [Rubripirellula sp.]
MTDSERDDVKHASNQGPNSIRGVALDMDGLLFDTEALYWQVGDTILQRRGFRFSKPLQQNMMGRVGVAAMQQMIDFHSLEDSPQDLLTESNELFGNLLTTELRPMEGLGEWIDLLQKSGLPFGLATSSQRKFVDVIFEQITWRESLAFTLTGDDVTRGKPDPQMYLMAAEKLAIDPVTMLVLEDSGNGCAAAVAANAYTVAVPSEHTREQSFDGAKLIADSLLDERLWQLVTG